MQSNLVNIPWDFAILLRVRRVDLGLTQRQPARIAGVSLGWLGRMERSGQRPELGLVCGLVQALTLELTLG